MPNSSQLPEPTETTIQCSQLTIHFVLKSSPMLVDPQMTTMAAVSPNIVMTVSQETNVQQSDMTRWAPQIKCISHFYCIPLTPL